MNHSLKVLLYEFILILLSGCGSQLSPFVIQRTSICWYPPPEEVPTDELHALERRLIRIDSGILQNRSDLLQEESRGLRDLWNILPVSLKNEISSIMPDELIVRLVEEVDDRIEQKLLERRRKLLSAFNEKYKIAFIDNYRIEYEKITKKKNKCYPLDADEDDEVVSLARIQALRLANEATVLALISSNKARLDEARSKAVAIATAEAIDRSQNVPKTKRKLFEKDVGFIAVQAYRLRRNKIINELAGDVITLKHLPIQTGLFLDEIIHTIAMEDTEQLVRRLDSEFQELFDRDIFTHIRLFAMAAEALLAKAKKEEDFSLVACIQDKLDQVGAITIDIVRENRDLVARGRLYLWQQPEDLMARITPLGPRAMLLETPRGNSWIEHKRGRLATVLKYVESDTRGSFHGLGSLVAKKRGSRPSVQQILHSDFKIPIRVLAEPAYWYSMHRKPVIAETSDAKDRVLVRFVAYGISGSLHGTCLYALKNGEWGCYTIKPSASETIATAETWLDKREWEGVAPLQKSRTQYVGYA